MDFINKVTGHKSLFEAKMLFEKGNLEKAKQKLLSIDGYELTQNAEASFLLAKIFIQEGSNNHKKIVKCLSDAMSFNHKEAKELYYQYYDGYGNLKGNKKYESINNTDLDTEEFKTKYRHEYEVNTFSKEIRNRELAYFNSYINKYGWLHKGSDVTSTTLEKIYKVFPNIKKEDIIFYTDSSTIIVDNWFVFTANHFYDSQGQHGKITDIVAAKEYLNGLIEGRKLLVFHEDGTTFTTTFVKEQEEFMELVKLTKDFIPYLSARADEFYDGKVYDKAYLFYLENAVKYNDYDAQKMLSVFYKKGLSVQKDSNREKYWETLASRRVHLIDENKINERYQKVIKEEIEKERLEKETKDRKLAEEKRKKEEKEQQLLKEKREREKQEKIAKFTKEEQAIYQKEIERKERVEAETTTKANDSHLVSTDDTFEREFRKNPKASAIFARTLENEIYNITDSRAMIAKEFFKNQNKADIKKHFKDVKLEDVVYFYDGALAYSKNEWAVVTTKEFITSSGQRISLIGIVDVKMSIDQDKVFITYVDRNKTISYDEFSTYIIERVARGTINAYRSLWIYAKGLENKKSYKEAFDLYLEAAINGANMDAYNSLGFFYHSGWYVDKNLDRANLWYEKGSAAGNAYSMSNLALNYKNKKEYGKAWIHLNRALDLKNAPNRASILNTAGLMYLNGLGVDKNYNQALSYFRESSIMGNMYATYNLANHAFYYDYNFVDGVHYALLGIKQGHKATKKMLGDAYYHGKFLPKNKTRALYWYREAKKEKLITAYTAVGNVYFENKKYKEAIEEYQEGIKQGGITGYSSIAKVYLDENYSGYNVDEALYYLEKGVKNESATAMIQLGKMYLEGKGVIQDYTTAKELFEKAKAKEDLDANGQLALMYLNGWGVSKDIEKAKALFQEAYEDHNTATTYEMAKACLENKISTVSNGLSYLFDIAQRTGHSVCNDAKKTLIDYFASHTAVLDYKESLKIIDYFNDVYAVDPSILDKKADVERSLNIIIPIYAIKETIDYQELSKQSSKDQLLTLLDIYSNNPKHYEVCEAIGNMYFLMKNYENAYYYLKQVFYASDYKMSVESLYHYYYLCVEVNHDYDKGKYMQYLVSTSYPEGKELFVKLVHKHINQVKTYEYAIDAYKYTEGDNEAYLPYKNDLFNIVMKYHEELNKQFKIADPRIMEKLYNHMEKEEVRNSSKKEKLKKNVLDGYDKIYSLANQGCVEAIQIYMDYAQTNNISNQNRTNLFKMYKRINASLTPEGILKLANYYLKANMNQEAVNVLRDLIVFHSSSVDSIQDFFKEPMKIDGAYYSAIAIPYAFSDNVDRISIMTKLIKTEYVDVIDTIKHAKKDIEELLNVNTLIQDIHVLKDLYKNGEYAMVYESVVDLAKENNSEAQILLGKLYQYGQCVQQSYDEAKKWYTLAHEAKNSNATLCLAHLSYELANTPSELKEVYSLYVDAYSVADKQACKNAIEISDLISFDYNNTMFWKLKEYELGDKEAGKFAATCFYTGLCDQNVYRRYFEKLARNADPFGLRTLATAYHMGYGCEINKTIAHKYEARLIETLTGNIPKTGDPLELFTMAISHGKETADEILDYLLSIEKASIKQYKAKRDGGYGFLQVCFNIQKHSKSICFILANNRYHYAQVMLQTANTHMRLFDKKEEVTLIAIGEDNDYFMTRAEVELESFVAPAKSKKERPQREDLDKKVDQCWDLYDQGKYDEAYKMVLPIAKKGIGKAINMMATLHEKGKGVPANLNKAIEWYELGIKKDYWACFNNLGNLYYNYSVDENQGKVAAYQFYKQVIYKTNKVVAKRALDILLSGLVPYNEDEKQQWIKRLIELGEEEYVNALNK